MMTTTEEPTTRPTSGSSSYPSDVPSNIPSGIPSNYPSIHPSLLPSSHPSKMPSINPSLDPSLNPSLVPSLHSSLVPSLNPTLNPVTNSPTNPPTENPTDPPTSAPTRSPVAAIITDPLCVNNLGTKLSEATGQGTIDPYPLIDSAASPKGYDNSASVLVNGNLTVEKGAEIEGKIVVLGNFQINLNSKFHSFVRAGVGSQVVPNDGEDAILVGGNLVIDKESITFMSPGYGNIVHKGTRTGELPQLDGQSKIIHDTNLDLSDWSDAFLDLEEKGSYWGSLNANGNILGIHDSNTITFEAGDGKGVQVFHVKATDLTKSYGRHVKFHQNLVQRTILINVEADSNGKAHIQNLADFFDTAGKHGFFFSSALVSQILWNFYDATEVIVGCGSTGVGEWRGSILVPTRSSSMEFCMPGHSGRIIVNGNLVQDREGSEFHNYDFDPPIPLPIPPSYSDCDDILTPSPTEPPSDTPSNIPSGTPSNYPSMHPSLLPSSHLSPAPTGPPTRFSTVTPSSNPTLSTNFPTNFPTNPPSETPTDLPTPSPSEPPSPVPMEPKKPSPHPSSHPSEDPSIIPSFTPSLMPTQEMSRKPSRLPSSTPSLEPSNNPSLLPSSTPSGEPSNSPSLIPSSTPTKGVSHYPSHTPSSDSSKEPSMNPSLLSSSHPSKIPSINPSEAPVVPPTEAPSLPEVSFVCEKPKSCTSASCTTQCPLDVPSGYYPDLKDCKSYCFCTGTTAKSRYDTCGSGQYFDPLGWNAPRGWPGRGHGSQWMNGKWGPGTYWGSNGSGCNWKNYVEDTRPNPPNGCSSDG